MLSYVEKRRKDSAVQRGTLRFLITEQLDKERRHSVNSLFSGDGANDVSMIQAADIGIGISGQEGMQVMYDLTPFSSLISFTLPGDLRNSPQCRTNHPLSIIKLLTGSQGCLPCLCVLSSKPYHPVLPKTEGH